MPFAASSTTEVSNGKSFFTVLDTNITGDTEIQVRFFYVYLCKHLSVGTIILF